MSDIVASTQTFSLKQAGLLVALAMSAAVLSGCDCDGDCNAPIVSGATASSPTVPATPVTPAPTPTVTPTPAPTPTPTSAPAARCADPRFCKVSSTGEILDDSATSWSCVQDKLLGNFWEVKDPAVGSLRNKDWTYAKEGSAGACGGTVAGCSVAAYVDAVNAGTRPCGPARECRLPRHADLMYLAFPSSFLTPVVGGEPTTAGKVTSTRTNYPLPTAFFPDVVTSGFYFNATDDRQVNYNAVIDAGVSVDAISLEGMASYALPTMAGHVRLLCK